MAEQLEALQKLFDRITGPKFMEIDTKLEALDSRVSEIFETVSLLQERLPRQSKIEQNPSTRPTTQRSLSQTPKVIQKTSPKAMNRSELTPKHSRQDKSVIKKKRKIVHRKAATLKAKREAEELRKKEEAEEQQRLAHQLELQKLSQRLEKLAKEDNTMRKQAELAAEQRNQRANLLSTTSTNRIEIAKRK